VWSQRTRADRGSAAGILGMGALVLFLLGTLAVIVAFALSVTVNGHSMEPTLHTGDRLFVQLWAKHDIKRFDAVEATFQINDTATENVVKRVIGMPGDTVQVQIQDGKPVVTVIPKGSTQKYVVDNPTWDTTATAKLDPCCAQDGSSDSLDGGNPVVVPAGSYWLLGDNWGGSSDSRTYGFVKDSAIIGRMWLRLAPLSKFGVLKTSARLVPTSQ